jgi:hypothetical protein
MLIYVLMMVVGMVMVVVSLVLVNENRRNERRKEVISKWKRVEYLGRCIVKWEKLIWEEREKSGDWENDYIRDLKDSKRKWSDERLKLMKVYG